MHYVVIERRFEFQVIHCVRVVRQEQVGVCRHLDRLDKIVVFVWLDVIIVAFETCDFGFQDDL